MSKKKRVVALKPKKEDVSKIAEVKLPQAAANLVMESVQRVNAAQQRQKDTLNAVATSLGLPEGDVLLFNKKGSLYLKTVPEDAKKVRGVKGSLAPLKKRKAKR